MTAAAAAVWGPGSSIERVRKALEDRGLSVTRPHADDFHAQCSVHAEDSPSMHVTYKRSGGRGGGQVVLHCFGCQAPAADLVEALGLTMADLFDDPPPEREPDRGQATARELRRRGAGQRRRSRLGPLPKTLLPRSKADHDHEWEAVEVYHYANAAGEEVQRAVRWRCTRCGEKTFSQEYVDASGDLVARKPAGFVPVLYRHPETVSAIAAGQPVWLVEGEKDVHAAEAAGLTACTNASGGTGFPDELVEVFTGADVNVVLDRDNTGWRRGATLLDLLGPVALRVRIWLPATTEHKSDLADHLDAGHDVDDLIAVPAAEVQPWALAGDLEDALPRLIQCDDEARAQMEAADERRRTAKAAASQHEQNARRWAKESEVRFERFANTAERTLELIEELQTSGAEQIAAHVERLIEQAETTTRGAHETAHLGLSEIVTERAATLRARVHRPDPDAAEETVVEGPWRGPADTPSPVAPATGGESVTWNRYAYLDGGIVHIVDKSRRDGSTSREYRPIINVQVHLDVKEYVDADEQIDDTVHELLAKEYGETQRSIRDEPRVAAYIYSYLHPATQERITLRVPADRAGSGEWLDSIDVPGLNFARDRRGRQEVVRAIDVVSPDATSRVQARGTGWRRDPVHGWAYTHYAGMITAEGWKPATARFEGAMHRYALPKPITNPDELRSAFLEHSAALMTHVSPRVGAALLGVAYKAAIERIPYSPVILGNAGSGKTGLAATVMHHYGPAWDRNAPTATMTDNGSTPVAMRITAHDARDALAFYDDVTPGSSFVKAQERMGALLHSLFSQEIRDRGTREAGLQTGHRPWVTGMFTSEIMPKVGANARRAIILPIGKTELPIDAIIRLDDPASRMNRAVLMASMLQWAAGQLEELRAWIRTTRIDYAAALRADGRTTEEAEYGGHLWAGWAMMTRFLTEVGALTEAERHHWMQQVHTNLHAAIDSASDPDQPTSPGVRVLEILRGALRSGDLHLTNITDNHQPGDEGLAVRLGWTQVPSGYDPSGLPRWQLVTRGSSFRMGYLKNDDVEPEVLIDGEALERAVKIASAGLSEPLTMDRGTIRRALHDIGALKVENRGEGRQPILTLKRVIPAETDSTSPDRAPNRRVTVLKLAALLGDEDNDGGPTDDTTIPPMPPLPGGATPTTIDQPAAPQTPQDEASSGGDQTEQGEAMPPTERAARLSEPAECAWCRQPTQFSVDDVPMHARCWGEVNAQLDEQKPPQASTRHLTTEEASQAPSNAPEAQNAGAAGGETQAPQPAATAGPRTTKSRAATTTATVVLDTDAIYLPDGTTQPAPQLRHIGDAAALGDQLGLRQQIRKDFSETGTLVLSSALCHHLGLPIDDLPEDVGAERMQAFSKATTGHPFLTSALEDGWTVSKSPENGLRAWTRVWREGQRAQMVTFEPLLPERATEDADPAAIARRLEKFAHYVGIAWRVTPQSTGFDLMESLRWKDRERLFTVHEPVQPARREGDIDFNWSRKPTPEELDLPYVHVYDRGGSYMAGVAGLELPEGEPVHHENGTEFDPRVPGYWLVDRPEAADWRYPHPLFTPDHRRDRLWVTTPTLELAASLGYDTDNHEAYTWPQHSRLLDPWYRRIRDASAALDSAGPHAAAANDLAEYVELMSRADPDDKAARDLLKAMYTRTIGMMGSSRYMAGRPHYWPERRHHIVAKARANLLRQILKIGAEQDIWPLAVRTDSVMYASAEPDIVKAWPGDRKKFGSGFGNYKPERTGLLEDQLPYLGNSRGWEGKPKLDKVLPNQDDKGAE